MKTKVLNINHLLLLLVVIAGVSAGGFYYHTETLKALEMKYDGKVLILQDQLNSQGETLETLSTVVTEQGVELKSQLVGVQAELSEELERVEYESAGKIAGIEQELLNIDVETKGFTGIIEQTKDSVVSLKTNLGYGSGVVVAKDGYVLTNHHVIDGISGLSIEFANGQKYRGRIAGFDKRADLALLKIGSEKRFRPLSFGKFRDVIVGQKVIAMGSPAGLDFTVTEGIVSSVNRKNNFGFDVLQMSVPINPGNSGGPLIDGNGLIVGINTFKIGNAEALGFAMNPDTAHEFALVYINKDRELLEAAAEAENAE